MSVQERSAVVLEPSAGPRLPGARSPLVILGLSAVGAVVVTVAAVLAPVPVVGGLLMAVLAVTAWRYPGFALVALLLLLPFNVAIFTALVNKGGAHVGRLGDWKDALIVLLFVRGIVMRRARDGGLRMPVSGFSRFLVAYVLLYCVLAVASPHLSPAIYALSRDVEGPLLFLAIVCLRPSRRTVIACMFVVLGAATVIGVAAVYEHLGPRAGFLTWYGSAHPRLGSSFYPGSGGYRSGSFLDSPLILAFYLAVSAPVALGASFALRRRPGLPLLAGVAAAASVAGIIFAETRSGYLGAGGGILVVLFFALRNKAVRTALVGIFVIAVAVAVVQNENTSAITRPGEDASKRQAWTHDFDVIASNPLGLGLGSIDSVGQRFGVYAQGASASESELLARGIEGGVAALLLYPASLLLLVLYLVNLRRRALAIRDTVAVGLAAGAIGAAIAVLLAGLFLGIDELVVEVAVWGPAALAVAWFQSGAVRPERRTAVAAANTYLAAPLEVPVFDGSSPVGSDADLASPLPLVTVAVLPGGDAEQMRRCLRALFALDYPSVEVVVFIRDEDGLIGEVVAEAARSASVAARTARVPPSLDSLREWARTGARGDVLAFIDSECVVDGAWARAAVTALGTRADLKLVTGRTIPAPRSQSGEASVDASRGIRLLGSCNAFFDAASFRSLDDQRAAFADVWESAAAGVALSAGGWKAAYVPAAVAGREEASLEFGLLETRYRDDLFGLVARHPQLRLELLSGGVLVRPEDAQLLELLAALGLARRHPRAAAKLAAPYLLSRRPRSLRVSGLREARRLAAADAGVLRGYFANVVSPRRASSGD